MLSITETFDEFQRIGCCGFATLDGHGGVSSRIAHFFAADEEGLYLRTMTGKPFYRELVEGGQLSFTGERYDYDFNMVMRDHKIERERFCWGGASIPEAAFHITDACIACGACAQACTHKAIVAGAPYRILGNRCDECGNCHHACPVGAVVEKGVA